MDESSELESLERVSHRLALTDDANFGSVIAKLLPKLLNYIGRPSNSERVRTTLVKILSHVMMRAKGNRSVPLPVGAVLSILYDAEKGALNDVGAFTKNFAVAFLEVRFGFLLFPCTIVPPFPSPPFLCLAFRSCLFLTLRKLPKNFRNRLAWSATPSRTMKPAELLCPPS